MPPLATQLAASRATWPVPGCQPEATAVRGTADQGSAAFVALPSAVCRFSSLVGLPAYRLASTSAPAFFLWTPAHGRTYRQPPPGQQRAVRRHWRGRGSTT